MRTIGQVEQRKVAKELWLQKEARHHTWLASQVDSFNARVSDYLVGGRNAPRLADLRAWRARLIERGAKGRA
jgi:hypothetical protein